MKTKSNNDQIYIGRKAGIEGTNLMREILNTKNSLKIVSPYLSRSYLRHLVELSKKGVKITLITADELEQGAEGFSDFRQADIIKQKKIVDADAKKSKSKIKKISALGLILSLFSVIFYFVSPVLMIIPIALVSISLFGFAKSYSVRECRYEYYSIFRLKIFDSSSGEKPRSKELIHSKIFVIDENTAFLGSANFTYSGFNTHYETLIKIEDKKAVIDISREVESLYNSTELEFKQISELGKQIYELNQQILNN